MMRGLLCALGMSLCASSAWAQRAASPADATVFIRLTGNAHVEVEEIGQRRQLDLERVELGSGSGFVISPQGHILTNQHVIGNSTRTQNRPPVKTTVSLEVTRIEACFPSESVAARAVGSRCVDATLLAADAELDLAVLSITAPNLPYVALGDSDAVTRGLPVQASGIRWAATLKLDARQQPTPCRTSARSLAPSRRCARETTGSVAFSRSAAT